MRNEWTQHFEEHPEELKPFPEQALYAAQQGVSHLGGDEDTEVDPNREFFPCGQGVGAIHELRPAADLVHEFVAEAEKVIDRLSGVRSTRGG